MKGIALIALSCPVLKFDGLVAMGLKNVYLREHSISSFSEQCGNKETMYSNNL